MLTTYQAECLRHLAERLNDRPGGELWPADFGLTYDQGEQERQVLRAELNRIADDRGRTDR